MSVVQFNLLPDTKARYVKAKKNEQLVVSIALLVAGVALAIFLITMSIVYGVQKKQVSDADKGITQLTAQLNSTPDLSKILTVQNQMGALVSLHQQKNVASRVFDYLQQVTPAPVTVSKLTVSFTGFNMDINGTAPSLAQVNTFVDTLKFTSYKNAQGAVAKAFPSVVERSFGLNNDGTANYALNVKFDPNLFVNSKSISLIVPPNLTTTRSVLDDSSALFKADPNATKKAGQ